MVTLTARASDHAGNESVRTTQFFVSVDSPESPNASFEVTEKRRRRVSLSADASHDPDGLITRWEWYFGDDTTGVGRHIRKTYRTPGRYEITLVVRDNEGGVGIARKTIDVSRFFSD